MRSGWKKGGIGLAFLMAGMLPASAEDIALVIGNRLYESAPTVRGGTAVVAAASALRNENVATIVGADQDLVEMRRLLSQFEQMVPSADGLLVVLAGRFVQGGGDTWFLPADSDIPGLTALPSRSLAVSSVMRLLASAPGRAVLMLASDERDAEQGPFLQEGIGPIVPAQGVTVVTGDPAAMARLLREVVARPGEPLDGTLAERENLSVTGFLPRNFTFLPVETGDPAALEEARQRLSQLRAELERLRQASDADRAAAERAAAAQERAERGLEAQRAAAQSARETLGRADSILWNLSEREDSLTAYNRYLEAFPEGRFADEARRAVREIRDEPNRSARLGEEAMNLSRSQRQEIQRALTILGYRTNGIDGIFGGGTRSAISAFQRDQNLTQTAYLTRDQVRRLTELSVARASELRSEEQRRQDERQQTDIELWQRLGEGRNEAGLRAYLERFPDGQYSEFARRRLNEIANAQARNVDADDRLAWRRATALNSIRSYQEYMQNYPRGTFIDEAEGRIDLLRGNSGEDEEAVAAENRLGLNTVTRRSVEERLSAMGLDPGAVDGTFDDRTRRALRLYQQNAALPVTGYLSETVVVRLLADAVRNILR